MKTYKQLVQDGLDGGVKELMPWDLVDLLASDNPPLLLDIREPDEFAMAHIPNSLNVPRGILEGACEYGYEDTVPELAAARERHVVVICRSGNRSVLAAFVMQLMGYQSVISLKTGVRGWNDYEQPLQDKAHNPVDIDDADVYLNQSPRPEQLQPS